MPTFGFIPLQNCRMFCFINFRIVNAVPQITGCTMSITLDIELTSHQVWYLHVDQGLSLSDMKSFVVVVFGDQKLNFYLVHTYFSASCAAQFARPWYSNMINGFSTVLFSFASLIFFSWCIGPQAVCMFHENDAQFASQRQATCITTKRSEHILDFILD